MLNKINNIIEKIKNRLNTISSNDKFKNVFNIVTYIISGLMLLNLLFIWFSFLTNSMRQPTLYYDEIYKVEFYWKYPNLAYTFIFLLITSIYAINMFLLFIKRKNTVIVINSLMISLIYLLCFANALQNNIYFNIGHSLKVCNIIYSIIIIVLMISLLIYYKINNKMQQLISNKKIKMNNIISIYTMVIFCILIFVGIYYLIDTLIQNKNIIFDRLLDKVSKIKFNELYKNDILPTTLYIMVCSCFVVRLITNFKNKRNSLFLVPFTLIGFTIFIFNLLSIRYITHPCIYCDGLKDSIAIGYSYNILIPIIVLSLINLGYFILFIIWYLENRKHQKKLLSEVLNNEE